MRWTRGQNKKGNIIKKAEIEKEGDRRKRARLGRDFIPLPSSKPVGHDINLLCLNHIRTGYSRFQHNMNQMGLSPSASRQCGAASQTALHTASECPLHIVSAALQARPLSTPPASVLYTSSVRRCKPDRSPHRQRVSSTHRQCGAASQTALHTASECPLHIVSAALQARPLSTPPASVLYTS